MAGDRTHVRTDDEGGAHEPLQEANIPGGVTMIKKYLRLFFTICIAIYGLPGLTQSLTIHINEGHYQVDDEVKLILSRIDNIGEYTNLSPQQELIIALGTDEYIFNTVPDQLAFSESYQVSSQTTGEYTLYLTKLPIIAINTDKTISDDPKVLAGFSYADTIQSFTSHIGIELRGGYSQSFPKKTFDLEFWQDESGTTSRNVSFGSLRVDDDWILDAMYNEPLRIRSYIAHKLWLQLHQPFYIGIEPFAKAGADVMLVEVFLNNRYNGVYLLSEQIDKKSLKLHDFDGGFRGELYKSISWGGACTFSELPAYSNNSRYWGGYDFKYPDAAEITDWSNLYEFTDFVMNSADADFTGGIWDQFSKENCMDYYIFLNLLRAADNRGKNIYLAKYDAYSPYFYAPWDLDACFGTSWQGTNDPVTDNILTNGMFKRALNLNAGNFRDDVGNLWHAHRKDIFSSENLDRTFIQAYQYLRDNNVYNREKLVYPNYTFSEESFTYMRDWVSDRVSFLDTYFVESPLSAHTFTPDKSRPFTFYPNPANNYIYIRLNGDTESVAYTIYNALGKSVQGGSLINGDLINLGKLEPGIYFLEIDHVVQKLIVR